MDRSGLNAVESRLDAPIAFGYVRSEDADEDQIETWDKELTAFCGDNYVLASVYCDRNCDGMNMTRPSFAGLLDALALPICMALVLPGLEHLSPDTVIREALLQQVRRANVQVLVVHQSNGQADATGLSRQGVPVDETGGGEPS